MTHRDSMAPEVGGLGKKVERKSETVRQDEEVAPGIFKDSKTGHLYTCRPENELANIPVYDWTHIK